MSTEQVPEGSQSPEQQLAWLLTTADRMEGAAIRMRAAVALLQSSLEATQEQSNTWQMSYEEANDLLIEEREALRLAGCGAAVSACQSESPHPRAQRGQRRSRRRDPARMAPERRR